MRRLLLVSLALAGAASAADWSEPIIVRAGIEPCISYRAKLSGDRVIVEARPVEGWHTFAMDNERRAKEALAGKMSLGIDGPTEISVSGGLKAAGPWLQSEPENFSKPELRWFSWGYEQPALFAARVQGDAPAVVSVKGQACSDEVCKNVEIEIRLSVRAAEAPDLSGLIEVRR